MILGFYVKLFLNYYILPVFFSSKYYQPDIFVMTVEVALCYNVSLCLCTIQNHTTDDVFVIFYSKRWKPWVELSFERCTVNFLLLLFPENLPIVFLSIENRSQFNSNIKKSEKPKEIRWTHICKDAHCHTRTIKTVKSHKKNIGKVLKMYTWMGTGKLSHPQTLALSQAS